MLKSRHVSGTTAAFTASTGCAGLPDTDVVPLRLPARSEEHTSELQSQSNLVCRLLLEKKEAIVTLLPPVRAALNARAHPVAFGRWIFARNQHRVTLVIEPRRPRHVIDPLRPPQQLARV